MTFVASATAPEGLDGFLDTVPAGSGALVISGPAGIGKSSLWSRVVDDAARRGWLVLRAHPSEAEARLVGSALLDLLGEVPDALVARLPSPQAAVLSAALLRTPATGGSADPHTVAVSLASLVRLLAADRPLLVAIDDVQWLDAETSAALCFVVRRMPTAGMGVVLAWRTEPHAGEPDLVAAAGGTALRCIVPPMPPEQLERVIGVHLSRPVPGTVLRRAVQVSGGNPLYAIEVARALVASGGSAASEQVRLPPSLQEVIGARLRALPEDARMALAAAAALTRPTVGQLHTLGLDRALVAAERAGLAAVAGAEVRFEHPLFAAAAYDDLVGSERTMLHSRLAEVAEGPEERARHLALGVGGPDAAVAMTLDEASRRAIERGALYAAIDAARLALLASPDNDPAAADRRLALGELLFRAGDADGSRRELESVAWSTAGASTRARALKELARIAVDTEPGPRAVEMARSALLLAATDDLAADIHVIMSLACYDDVEAALDHARTAVTLLQRSASPDPGRLAAAMAAAAEAGFRAGHGVDHDACETAMELEARTVPPPVSNRAITGYAFMLMYADELDRARELFRQAHQMAVEEGDHGSLPEPVGHLSMLELWAGHWQLADRYARDGLEYAERTGQDHAVLTARADVAWVQVHRGDLDEAREVGGLLVRVGSQHADVATESWGSALLGFCALADGDPAGAVGPLSRHAELRAGAGSREPGFNWIAPYYIQALTGAGNLDRADAALAAYAEDARSVGRRSALAAVSRGRALLCAARGDLSAALLAAEDAVERYDDLGRPFDRAQALLAKGQLHRRLKQKALAKQALGAALGEFERLGARPFAQQANAELSRIGLRPAAPLHLTQTEQRIAELTAQGMTTKEVAAALFLSPRTVAGNLTKIYRKLGVRNRSELSGHLRDASGKS